MNNDDAPLSLSVRLEMIATIHEKSDFIVANICREAAELARKVEVAPRGEIQSVNFEDVRPVWEVMDDRDAVPLNEPRRVALVPLG